MYHDAQFWISQRDNLKAPTPHSLRANSLRAEFQVSKPECPRVDKTKLEVLKTSQFHPLRSWCLCAELQASKHESLQASKPKGLETLESRILKVWEHPFFVLLCLIEESGAVFSLLHARLCTVLMRCIQRCVQCCVQCCLQCPGSACGTECSVACSMKVLRICTHYAGYVYRAVYRDVYRSFSHAMCPRSLSFLPCHARPRC